jgi:teichoic acid transport system permease protein
MSQEVSAPLVRLGVRQPVGEYLREIWARREFADALARNDLRARHMNSFFGQLWHLINPALNILIYFLIFGVLLDARRNIDNYVSFLVVGVMFFRLCQNSVTTCANSITSNTGLIRSIQFPRALVPLSTIYESLLAFLPGLGLVMVVVVLDGAGPVWNWLALPLVMVVITMLNLGFGFTAARIGSTIPDLNQVLPHAFRILLYLSGVLFSVQNVVSNTTVQTLFALNPFYGVVAAARWSLMAEPMGRKAALALVVWAIGALIVGFHTFRRQEHRYGA